VIALGANLGDARQTLRLAVAGLANSPGLTLRTVSGLWRTAAVGGPEQPDYLNAVVLVDCVLPARELLGVCQALEQAAGRTRLVRWGPRTLDLDILAFGSLISDDPTLTLPHPRAHERAFVLAPWAQVAPEWPLVALGRNRTVAQWRSEVAGQEVSELPDRDWWR
jgi:dihydroneopterin aldolase/2-amino-4-hydroxy-6-hydroxymethyldihydropteridine diphosphokinase